MVDDMGNPKLIDFGVSRITGEGGYTTSGQGISWAWAAPELLFAPDDELTPKTTASDVYALAITYVEESSLPVRSRLSVSCPDLDLLDYDRTGPVPRNEQARHDESSLRRLHSGQTAPGPGVPFLPRR